MSIGQASDKTKEGPSKEDTSWFSRMGSERVCGHVLFVKLSSALFAAELLKSFQTLFYFKKIKIPES